MKALAQNWIWLDEAVMIAIHDEQLAEHGGIVGVRDTGMFQSALNRAPNLAHDGQPDVAELAAAYGVGLAKNHPFLDGNKRTAFVAIELFLALNGYVLTASDADCVITMLGVASGDINEVALAEWIRHNSQSRT